MHWGMDSRLYRITSRIEELIVLNLLLVVCCVPVVTIGAAVTAFYAVLLRMLRGENGRIHKDFFQAFRANWKQATVIWLILLAVGIVFLMDLRISNMLDGGLGFALRTVFWIFIAVYSCLTSYVFAVLARFQNTIRGTLWNAFWMSMGRLPFTISILVFELLPLAIIFWKPDSQWMVLAVMLVIGIAAQGLCCAWVFQHIFKQYIPEEEETDEE